MCSCGGTGCGNCRRHPKTDTRPEALAAASDQQQIERQRANHRLAADLTPTAPARVPVPVATRTESSPWEKFSGGHLHQEVRA